MKRSKLLIISVVIILGCSALEIGKSMAYEDTGKNEVNKLNAQWNTLMIEKNNNEMVSEEDKLLKEIFQLKQRNMEMAYKIRELEANLKKANEENNKVPVIAKIYNKKYISVDGNTIKKPDNTIFLKYNNDTFIPMSFIRQYYSIDEQGEIIIKGRPIENEYILKTESIVYLNDLYKEIEEKFKKQVLDGNYYDISKKLDGIEIEYGEVGFRRYIITKPIYMTKRHITVGSTREEVQKEYGKLGSDDDEAWYTVGGSAEYSAGNQYKFVFKENKVVEIHYGWVS
ncbi:MAG: hypothetical protein MJA31_03645 [Clostridia bacterium]|nr:hypothetical protein [Clostridia bacterium]